MKEMLKRYCQKKIVVDTRSSWIYIGILEDVASGCIVLSGVDVHDNRDTATTKERYVMESKTGGIRPNRECVYINLDCVVSFSPLNEVMEF